MYYNFQFKQNIFYSEMDQNTSSRHITRGVETSMSDQFNETSYRGHMLPSRKILQVHPLLRLTSYREHEFYLRERQKRTLVYARKRHTTIPSPTPYLQMSPPGSMPSCCCASTGANHTSRNLRS